jgi:hypothetical protein
MKVIIILKLAGVNPDNPIIIPTAPVAKNIIINTLTLVGSMYRIIGIKKGQYYKLTVKWSFC